MSHDNSMTSVSVSVLTVSDTRKECDDESGDRVVSLLEESGHVCQSRELVKDNQHDIRRIINTWLEDPSIEAVILTGGTGVSKQDVTPNAIEPMCTSMLTGFGELFRTLSFEEIGPASMLSRAGAGLIDVQTRRVPVFFLPGSPHAVELAVGKLIAPQLGHLVDICNEKVDS